MRTRPALLNGELVGRSRVGRVLVFAVVTVVSVTGVATLVLLSVAPPVSSARTPLGVVRRRGDQRRKNQRA
ncbi:hypothetical protein [Rhodococcus sp. 27YEA15]|uniref:hypothetical protein n=1 Tax=Rhodococcus sp. 27YEA15 TaxID=3156259 RepID=UPI003C7D58AD